MRAEGPWRRDNAMESLKKEWEGVKLMEEAVPFFQSVRLPRAAKYHMLFTPWCPFRPACICSDILTVKEPICGDLTDQPMFFTNCNMSFQTCR